jgi:hypothetical protein
VGIGGGDGLGVEGVVQQRQPGGDDGVEVLLGGDRRGEPGGCRLGPVERLEGTDRGRPRQRQLGRRRGGFSLARSPAPA